MADWTKTINVDKHIVPLLSEAAYTDIYQVIREFVNNGYDADATRVDIKIDYEKDNYIEIVDNGTGMTVEEFETNFLTIARTPKMLYSRTKYGRPIVGKFGIGYLSAIHFCKNLQIESTTKGNQEIFEASIDCMQFLKPGKQLVWEIPVPGRTIRAPSKEDESYTKITLKNLTNPAIAFFKRKREVKRLRSSIKGWDGLDSLKWKLQQILPLEYQKEEQEKEYYKFLKTDTDFGKSLDVYLNNEQLFRNPIEGEIIDKGTEKIGSDIEFKYVIATPWKTVRPQEKVGLQTRLNNVGVGLPDLFGASFLTGHLFVTTRWINGEILLLKGLENDISINRNEFNDTEEYIKFFNNIHQKIYNSLRETEKRKPSTRKLGRIEKKVGRLKDTLVAMDHKEEKPILIKNLMKENREITASYVDQIYDKIGEEGVFDVEIVDYTGNLNQDPIEIDKEEKKIKLVENHPALKEHIFIKNQGFIVEYNKWKTEKENLQDPLGSACKLNIKNNKIILNADFILFQDSNYKEIYKEIFTILSYMTQKHPNNKDAFNMIAEIMILNYLNREEYE